MLRFIFKHTKIMIRLNYLHKATSESGQRELKEVDFAPTPNLLSHYS